MRLRRSFQRSGFLLLLWIAAAAAEEPKPAPRYEMVDGHLHFLNFVQETAGMDAFLKAMDDTGVAESVVIGMPVVKKWDEGDDRRPTYYLVPADLAALLCAARCAPAGDRAESSPRQLPGPASRAPALGREPLGVVRKQLLPM